MKNNGNLSRKRNVKENQKKSKLLCRNGSKMFVNIKLPFRVQPYFRKHRSLLICLEILNLKATDRWLSRRKDQSNIVYRLTRCKDRSKLHGERQDANFASAEDRIMDVWPTLIKDYKSYQIFNADETGQI